MADVLHPVVRGTIAVQFNGEALLRRTREQRNEYLTALRLKIQSILDEARCSCGSLIDGWYVELYEYEEKENGKESDGGK